jgi:hypothetical protein
MNQALYAHMNNKRKMKKKKRIIGITDKTQSRAQMTSDMCFGRWQQYQIGQKTDRHCSVLMALSMLSLAI